MAADKTPQAIAILRDAIDVSPLDPDLRVTLVIALGTYAPDLAAQEAQNAGFLMPDVVELRTMAARAWLRAGQPENALAAINEAIARDPDAVPTRLLVAEIALSQLKPENALEHLDFVIAKADTPEARFLRALAWSLAGKPTEMRADMDLASGNLQDHYDLATEIIDRGIQLDANQVRSLLQRIVVNPDEKVSVDLASKLQVAYLARATFCEMLPVPPAYKAVHEQRLLALRLMAQTMSDIQSFMGGGGENALSDARIDLAEALRNAAEAKVAETQVRQKAN